jgi:hypothetical protein
MYPMFPSLAGMGFLLVLLQSAVASEAAAAQVISIYSPPSQLVSGQSYNMSWQWNQKDEVRSLILRFFVQ